MTALEESERYATSEPDCPRCGPRGSGWPAALAAELPRGRLSGSRKGWGISPTTRGCDADIA